MSQNPLDAYKEYDPKVIECYKSLQDLTYGEGALKTSLHVQHRFAKAISSLNLMQGAIALGQRALALGGLKGRNCGSYVIRLI